MTGTVCCGAWSARRKPFGAQINATKTQGLRAGRCRAGCAQARLANARGNRRPNAGTMALHVWAPGNRRCLIPAARHGHAGPSLKRVRTFSWISVSKAGRQSSARHLGARQGLRRSAGTRRRGGDDLRTRCGRAQRHRGGTAQERRCQSNARSFATSRPRRVASALLAACPNPDILINNAGGPPPGDFRDFSPR